MPAETLAANFALQQAAKRGDAAALVQALASGANIEDDKPLLRWGIQVRSA